MIKLDHTKEVSIPKRVMISLGEQERGGESRISRLYRVSENTSKLTVNITTAGFMLQSENRLSLSLRKTPWIIVIFHHRRFTSVSVMKFDIIWAENLSLTTLVGHPHDRVCFVVSHTREIAPDRSSCVQLLIADLIIISVEREKRKKTLQSYSVDLCRRRHKLSSKIDSAQTTTNLRTFFFRHKLSF